MGKVAECKIDAAKWKKEVTEKSADKIQTMTMKLKETHTELIKLRQMHER